VSEAVVDGQERWERGRAVLDAVYGAGFSDRYPPYPQVKPYSRQTVENLFGEVWTRPGLPIRDRRLLVLGAVSMLGRADLVKIQVLGGLRSGDFTEEQLRETVLQLAFYCGWPNATAFDNGLNAALADYAAETASGGDRTTDSGDSR